MKKLLCLLCLLGWSASAQTPVAFYLTNFVSYNPTGQSLNRSVGVTPLYPLLTQNQGILAGVTTWYTPANGYLQLSMWPNLYTINIEGLQAGFTIAVPALSTTQNVVNLSTNLSLFYEINSPVGSGTNVANPVLVEGAGSIYVVASTNQGVVTYTVYTTAGGGNVYSDGNNYMTGSNYWGGANVFNLLVGNGYYLTNLQSAINAANATNFWGTLAASNFASVSVPLAALQQGGATIGQGLEWSGSGWVPGNFDPAGAALAAANVANVTTLAGISVVSRYSNNPVVMQDAAYNHQGVRDMGVCYARGQYWGIDTGLPDSTPTTTSVALRTSADGFTWSSPYWTKSTNGAPSWAGGSLTAWRIQYNSAQDEFYLWATGTSTLGGAGYFNGPFAVGLLYCAPGVDPTVAANWTWLNNSNAIITATAAWETGVGTYCPSGLFLTTTNATNRIATVFYTGSSNSTAQFTGGGTITINTNPAATITITKFTTNPLFGGPNNTVELPWVTQQPDGTLACLGAADVTPLLDHFTVWFTTATSGQSNWFSAPGGFLVTNNVPGSPDSGNFASCCGVQRTDGRYLFIYGAGTNSANVTARTECAAIVTFEPQRTLVNTLSTLHVGQTFLGGSPIASGVNTEMGFFNGTTYPRFWWDMGYVGCFYVGNDFPYGFTMGASSAITFGSTNGVTIIADPNTVVGHYTGELKLGDVGHQAFLNYQDTYGYPSVFSIGANDGEGVMIETGLGGTLLFTNVWFQTNGNSIFNGSITTPTLNVTTVNVSGTMSGPYSGNMSSGVNTNGLAFGVLANTNNISTTYMNGLGQFAALPASIASATNGLGSAAWSSTSAFDASGAGTTAALNATNGLTSSQLKAQLGANAYDAYQAAQNATNGQTSAQLQAQIGASVYDAYNAALNATNGTAVRIISTNAAAAVTNALSSGAYMAATAAGINGAEGGTVLTNYHTAAATLTNSGNQFYGAFFAYTNGTPYNWALAAGSMYFTNITANSTVGGFSGIPNGAVWGTLIVVTNSSASTYTLTFPAGVVPNRSFGSTYAVPPVFYCTNGQVAMFQVTGVGALITNVDWAPH